MIRDGYMNKAQPLEKDAIEAAFNRIQNIFFRLPNESIQHISYLPLHDMSRLAQVSQRFKANVGVFEVIRAQEYGYKRENFAEGKNCLRDDVFQSFSTLIQANVIPEEYIIRQEADVNIEATYRKILFLSYEKAEGLKHCFNTALIKAVKQGNVKCVQALLQHGANPNFQKEFGKTPLLEACSGSKLKKEDQERIVEALLNHQANPNLANLFGDTPLLMARNPTVIEWLCQKGANIDHQNDTFGCTALHYVVKDVWSHDDTIQAAEILLRYHANPHLPNHRGETPWNWVMTETNYPQLIELFENYADS